MNGLISTKDTFDWLHICLNNKKNLYVQSGITGMIGMTGISGKLGISDIIIPRWYKSFPGPVSLHPAFYLILEAEVIRLSQKLTNKQCSKVVTHLKGQ